MADEETKPKRKAKDNPLYRLATLHGEPSAYYDEIVQKNRVAWNRWMAARISEELKTTLREKGWSDDELTPLSKDELRCVEAKVGSSLHEIFLDDFSFEDSGEDKIDFSDTEFEAPFFASGFVFPTVDFHGATFSRSANFGRTTFSGNARFTRATFSGNAHFTRATFSDHAYFDSAAFRGAEFFSAAFSGDANFDSATFSDDAYFSSATFSGRGDFGATFGRYAYFDHATFSDQASFAHAIFSDIANFVNAEMKNVTIFAYAKFVRPPAIFGAKLHEGTTWRYVTWPPPPKDKLEAGEYVEAYERLKLEMDRLKRHGDELDFFALELQCRRVIEGKWRGLPIAAYGALSNYGRSYVRPLMLLVLTVLTGSAPILMVPIRIGGSDFFRRASTAEAVGVSFTNTLGILGKPLIEADVLLGMPNWLKAVATVQMIFGIALLFLFGLGIRNRFRMK